MASALKQVVVIPCIPRFGNNFTYSLNPSYLVSDKLKLFVNVSSGFKAPTLTALYASYGDENLKAEKATGYEAGFQNLPYKRQTGPARGRIQTRH